MTQPRKPPSYAEPADWQWLVDDLRAHGLDSRARVGFLDALSVDVELGDGWYGKITTSRGDLRTYHWRDDPLAVYVSGPPVPHEGYKLDWFPPTDKLTRLPRAIVPLLKRIAGAPERPPSDPVVDPLTVDNADQALRAMLASASDFSSVWDGFCRFAAIAVEALDPAEDEDLVLFECAVGDAVGRGQDPAMLLVRQFTVTDDEPDADPDEHEIIQLTCELHFRPDPDLVDVFRAAAAVWGSTGPSLAQWVESVEASPPFDAASAAALVGVVVDQTPV